MLKKDKVIYQIYPKSFQDSNHDGIGDIPGVLSHLDYLEKLGIDVIWFNPMTVSPQKDNGYDISDYRALDPIFGTMEQFEELSKACDEKNIQIMFDMVFNHCSTEHEWFKRALAGEEKYKNYFIWRKGKGPGIPPTNWQSKFSGPAWEYVEQFDEWYLHLFDPTQADLNWDNPDVRQECFEILNFWREKGVHCFRFDVINLISKATVDEDDPNLFDGRQFYADGPRVHEYIHEMNINTFGDDEKSITVGELNSTTLKEAVTYTIRSAKELDMTFTFAHLKVDYKNLKKWELQPFDFMEMKRIFAEIEENSQNVDGWMSLFWNCHDQPRSVSRFGDDKKYRKESAKMLGAAIHMMRGTPYIYQGEEIGMPNAYFTDISEYVDVESTNIYKVLINQGLTNDEVIHILQARSRDNARTPMPWDDSENGGFSDVKPWIKAAEHYKDINVKNTLEDPDSIFYFYQKLIQIRKNYKVVQEGTYIPLLKEHDKVYAYERKWNDESLICINNFYPEETTIELPLEGYEILLSNYADAKVGNKITLRPYETIIAYKK